VSAPRRYLFVPAGGAGDGLGHVNRCLRLAEQLTSARPRTAPRPRITFLASRLDEAARRFLRHPPGKGLRGLKPDVLQELKPGRQWDLVILDDRATSSEELRRLQGSGPVVCLDEGGQARGKASFLIDAIPRLPGGDAPNLSSLALLELPARSRRKVKWPPKKVLVTFGAEDRENLSGRLLDVFLAKGLLAPSQITLVEGPLFTVHDWPRGITLVRNPANLAALLPSFDAVFAHFGITSLEAVACGVPVILLNPSPYHARLGRLAGFPDVGIKIPDVRVLRQLLADPACPEAHVAAFNRKLGSKRAWRLPALLASMRPQGGPRCPVCGRDGNKVLERFSDRTYRSCRGCGSMYLESFAGKKMRYGERYFGREYKAHYGRTYLQDFQAIKKASRERLAIVRALKGKGVDGALVDVGCAYGPFLAAALEERLPCFGIDVSDEAVAYVTKKLGAPAICASFESVQGRHLPGRISAVTLWYVIEHFTDVALVLKKAADLLPTGGVLAFSTPNGNGISARKDLRRFLDASPADHFTIFRPAGLDHVLAAHGFELRQVRITGHHPERFPGFLGKLPSGAGFQLLERVSRLLGLGDTFEAYAVKVDET
jgi:2-polyprenyl-3-methyl-5-hydroxy-6-metoxy-1,4-benzoquinol methylase/spore coat polysaccharide biosynthesis predicted glycosyltransferase SpsG